MYYVYLYKEDTYVDFNFNYVYVTPMTQLLNIL